MQGHAWYYWLAGALEQAGDKIDIVSHHTYGDSRIELNYKLNANTPFGDTPDRWGRKSPSLREVLEYTKWDGPVWLTETGWDSDKAGTSDPPWQVERLGQFLEDWFGDRPKERDWLDKVFIYEMSGSGKGLLHHNGTTKKAYHTYAAFIAANPVP